MENKIPEKMLGMKLPGGAKVQAVEVDVPHPGPGPEVYLLRTYR